MKLFISCLSHQNDKITVEFTDIHIFFVANTAGRAQTTTRQ